MLIDDPPTSIMSNLINHYDLFRYLFAIINRADAINYIVKRLKDIVKESDNHIDSFS